MKTSADRVKHVRENVLGMTQGELLKRVQISAKSLSNIETGVAGDRAVRDFVQQLQLNPAWVETGKGSIFLHGTEEGNVARIKAGGKQQTEEPYRDELILELRRRAEAAEADKSRLQNWVDRLINGKPNFLKALSSTSYSQLRKVVGE